VLRLSEGYFCDPAYRCVFLPVFFPEGFLPWSGQCPVPHSTPLNPWPVFFLSKGDAGILIRFERTPPNLPDSNLFPWSSLRLYRRNGFPYWYDPVFLPLVGALLLFFLLNLPRPHRRNGRGPESAMVAPTGSGPWRFQSSGRIALGHAFFIPIIIVFPYPPISACPVLLLSVL